MILYGTCTESHSIRLYGVYREIIECPCCGKTKHVYIGDTCLRENEEFPQEFINKVHKKEIAIFFKGFVAENDCISLNDNKLVPNGYLNSLL